MRLGQIGVFFSRSGWISAQKDLENYRNQREFNFKACAHLSGSGKKNPYFEQVLVKIPAVVQSFQVADELRTRHPLPHVLLMRTCFTSTCTVLTLRIGSDGSVLLSKKVHQGHLGVWVLRTSRPRRCRWSRLKWNFLRSFSNVKSVPPSQGWSSNPVLTVASLINHSSAEPFSKPRRAADGPDLQEAPTIKEAD